MRYIITSLILLASFASGCSGPSSDASSDSIDVGVVGSGVPSLSTGQHQWHAQLSSTPLTSHEDISRSLQYDPVYKSGVITTLERDPQDGSTVVSEMMVPATLPIVGMTARCGNEIYVVGERNGFTLIERWLIPRSSGAWYSWRAPASTAIGAPHVSSPHETGIDGGVYIHPAVRVDTPQVARETVYVGNAFQGCWGLKVDADGRYLVFRDDSYNVWQVDLSAGSAKLLLGPGTLDLSEFDTSFLRQHAERGRVYYRIARNLEDLLVLVDEDNSGVFSAPVVYTGPTAWTDAGFDLPWEEDFYRPN